MAERIRTGLRWSIGIALTAAGLNHFVSTELYVAIMPDYLPWHEALVWISGAAEIVLGIALLVPRTRTLAGWGIIALLIAVFPANLHMALHPERFGDVPSLALYARLPFQLVFIGLGWWAARPDPSPRPPPP